jgi:hypothetical protein
MIMNILAAWIPNVSEWAIITFLCFIVYGIPILLVIHFVRLSSQNKRENVRLRLEVGKLADEIEKVRKQQGKSA